MGISHWTDYLRLDQSLLRQHPCLLDEKHSGAISGAISLMGSVPYNSQVTANELNQTISSILPQFSAYGLMLAQ